MEEILLPRQLVEGRLGRGRWVPVCGRYLFADSSVHEGALMRAAKLTERIVKTVRFGFPGLWPLGALHCRTEVARPSVVPWLYLCVCADFAF